MKYIILVYQHAHWLSAFTCGLLLKVTLSHRGSSSSISYASKKDVEDGVRFNRWPAWAVYAIPAKARQVSSAFASNSRNCGMIANVMKCQIGQNDKLRVLCDMKIMQHTA
jgi:hypothetical protein